MEEYDRWRDLSPTGSQRRKLSFNPVGTWVPPAAAEEPVGAFEVSTTKRIFQVTAAVIYCLLAAGIVFGYAALKPVLIREGVYRSSCTQDELDRDVRVCYDQEIRLNFMFTVAAVSTNVCALPVGTILDRYGPRVSGLVGVVFLTAGCLFFAFAWDMPFDGYIPGYLFLALGGPFVFISSFQLSNAFPRYSGLILALLTGAFDTSSAIFLFYRLIYQATEGTFWPKKFFLCYLVVPVYILLVQLFLMPKQSYKTVGELVTVARDPTHDVHDSDNDLPDDDTLNTVRETRRQHRESIISEITTLIDHNNNSTSKDATAAAKQGEDKQSHSGVWGALHGKTATQQIASWWFVLITLFTVIQMTRINYFVATIRPQMEHLLGSYDAAVDLNTFFDVALPLGGVISVPFIGLILDNTSTTFVLALLVSIATTIGVLGVIPSAGAQYANICLFVVYRPLYYTAVSDYAAKVFGFATFGKVYGLIICLAGLFNFAQSGLDALTHKVFANDPVPVNVALLVAALVVGVPLVAFVWRKSGQLGREGLRREAMEAEEREQVMPNAEIGDGEGEAPGQGQGQNGFSGSDYGSTR